jgi:hypothetical protein
VKTITVNLKVPETQNEERKKFKATWREIITMGLAALSKPSLEPEKPPSLDPNIEYNLKISVKHLSEAWNLIKKISL